MTLPSLPVISNSTNNHVHSFGPPPQPTATLPYLASSLPANPNPTNNHEHSDNSGPNTAVAATNPPTNASSHFRSGPDPDKVAELIFACGVGGKADSRALARIVELVGTRLCMGYVSKDMLPILSKQMDFVSRLSFGDRDSRVNQSGGFPTNGEKVKTEDRHGETSIRKASDYENAAMPSEDSTSDIQLSDRLVGLSLSNGNAGMCDISGATSALDTSIETNTVALSEKESIRLRTDLQNALSQLELERATRQNELSTLQMETERLRSQILTEKSQWLAESEKQKREQEEALSQLKTEKALAEDEGRRLQSETDNLRSALESERSRHLAEKSRLGIEDSRRRAEHEASDVIMSNRLKNTMGDLAEARQTIDRYSREAAVREGETETTAAKVKALETDLAAARNEIDSLSKAVTSRDDETKRQMERAKIELEKTRSELDDFYLRERANLCGEWERMKNEEIEKALADGSRKHSAAIEVLHDEHRQILERVEVEKTGLKNLCHELKRKLDEATSISAMQSHDQREDLKRQYLEAIQVLRVEHRAEIELLRQMTERQDPQRDNSRKDPAASPRSSAIAPEVMTAHTSTDLVPVPILEPLAGESCAGSNKSIDVPAAGVFLPPAENAASKSSPPVSSPLVVPSACAYFSIGSDSKIDHDGNMNVDDEEGRIIGTTSDDTACRGVCVVEQVEGYGQKKSGRVDLVAMEDKEEQQAPTNDCREVATKLPPPAAKDSTSRLSMSISPKPSEHTPAQPTESAGCLSRKLKSNRSRRKKTLLEKPALSPEGYRAANGDTPSYVDPNGQSDVVLYPGPHPANGLKRPRPNSGLSNSSGLRPLCKRPSQMIERHVSPEKMNTAAPSPIAPTQIPLDAEDDRPVCAADRPTNNETAIAPAEEARSPVFSPAPPERVKISSPETPEGFNASNGTARLLRPLHTVSLEEGLRDEMAATGQVPRTTDGGGLDVIPTPGDKLPHPPEQGQKNAPKPMKKGHGSQLEQKLTKLRVKYEDVEELCPAGYYFAESKYFVPAPDGKKSIRVRGDKKTWLEHMLRNERQKAEKIIDTWADSGCSVATYIRNNKDAITNSEISDSQAIGQNYVKKAKANTFAGAAGSSSSQLSSQDGESKTTAGRVDALPANPKK